MVRKAALSVLMLLLVSVQALATTCEARCSMTAAMHSARQAFGMAHCHGMASGPSVGHSAVATITAVSGCAHHICKSELAFVQTPVTQELRVALQTVTPLGHNPMPGRIALSLQFRSGRSTHCTSVFDPLISSPRV
jgi:hypothetical protein